MKPYLSVTGSAAYRIKISGRVDADWSDFMDDVDLSVSQESGATLTTITGVVPDQAALFGLLCHLRDLGLALVSVELLSEDEWAR
jgi:hypothetical protein